MKLYRYTDEELDRIAQNIIEGLWFNVSVNKQLYA